MKRPKLSALDYAAEIEKLMDARNQILELLSIYREAFSIACNNDKDKEAIYLRQAAMNQETRRNNAQRGK